MSKTFWRRRPAFAALLLFACMARAAPAPRAPEVGQSPPTDAQLVERLAAPDTRTANAAIDEIMSRGERMIPLLMKLRGDRRYFNGSLSRGSEESSTSIPAPSSDPRTNRWLLKRGKLLTVEAAALYLITAIYHGTLQFADSPYLTDLSLPEVERRQGNTTGLIKRAWKSTAAWHGRLSASGLAKLKAADDHPLKAASVRFW
jgi:hypothetical protein